MKEILDSIKPVIENSHFVSIDEKAIGGFIDSIKSSDFVRKWEMGNGDKSN